MTQTTSSAEYLKLYHYSDAALQLDNNLVSEANQLRGALLHFEATCREPGYRLSVAHVADGMVMYGARAAVVDAWVRVVGLGFQAADGGGLAALLPSWLPPWLLWPIWPPIRWPVDPGFVIGPRPRPQPLLPIWPPYGWWLPPWIGRFPWWPPRDYRRIEIPKQPDPLLFPLPQAPKIIIDDPWPKMPQILPDPPAGSGGTGETELGKILPSPTKTVLRQDQLGEDDPLLKAIRYDRDKNGNLIKEGAWFGPINTVRDHIKAYGCLITSFTMLLRDRGQNTRVTDIYRANYKKKTGRSIEEDLAQDDDQDSSTEDVVLFDLNLDNEAIKDATHEKYQVNQGDNLLSGPIDESITKSPSGNPTTDRLRSNLKSHKEDGPLVIHVATKYSSSHWVVVDSYDEATNTFTLRDPMKGLVTGVRIPSPEYNPETAKPDKTKGVVYYLKSI